MRQNKVARFMAHSVFMVDADYGYGNVVCHACHVLLYHQQLIKYAPVRNTLRLEFVNDDSSLSLTW